MKKFINKNVCLLLIVSQILTSCGFTKILWGKRMGGIRIEGFFVDHDKNRVVLVNYLDPAEPHMNYSLTDPENKLIKIFEIASKSDEKLFSMLNVETRGSKVSGSFWIGIKNKNFSKEEIDFLEQEGFRGKDKTFVGNSYILTNSDPKWLITKTASYPSTKETITNICSQTNQTSNCTPIIKFIQPWEGSTNNLYTTPEKIGLAAATPFTIAADIITIPLIAAFWLVFGLGGAAHSGTHDVTPKATKK